jgi:hypothetical protein
MLVSEAIKILKKYYDPEQEILIDWVGIESFDGDGDTTPEIWKNAVDMIESGNHGSLDVDYISEMVYESQNDSKHMQADALMDEYRDKGMSPSDFI